MKRANEARFAFERLEALRRAPVLEVQMNAPTCDLAAWRDFRITYAPFDSMPAGSEQVVFVGLTPGAQQHELAFEALMASAQDGIRNPDVLRDLIRSRVAFAGSMRENVIAMLDGIGLPKLLRIASTRELFNDARDLLFTTSALRYPVYKAGNNYAGDAAIVREPIFREMLERLLAPQLAAAPRALVVPFGKWASAGVEHIAQRGLFDTRRALFSFPHPSGGNGHRKRLYQANKASLEAQLDRWFA